MANTPTTTAKAKPAAINPKAAIRQSLAPLRDKLDIGWVESRSGRIQEIVIGLKEFQDARTVGCYVAKPQEVRTHLIIEACRRDRKRLCVPAFRKERKEYEMCWLDEGQDMQTGRWGIPEPASQRWADIAEVDLMIVPLVAFDIYGRRLGHGGGYYDRLLAEHHGFKLCMAFEYQRVTAVPYDEYDVPVHLIVTEKEIYRAPAGEMQRWRNFWTVEMQERERRGETMPPHRGKRI